MEEKKEHISQVSVSETSQVEKKEESKKTNILPLFGLGLFVGLFGLVILSYVLTLSQVKAVSQQPLVLKSANFFSIPMAKVNGKKVLYTDYIMDLQLLTEFYKKNAQTKEITKEEISNTVVDRLVGLSVMEDIAKEFNIEIDDQEVEKQKTLIVDEFGGIEKAEEETQKTYNWSFDTYVERVIRPFVLEQAIRKVVAEKTDLAEDYPLEQVRSRHILFPLEEGMADEAMRKKATSVLERIQAGEEFATLAEEFGTDGTASRGGDLGWFGRGEMVAEFEDAVFGLEVGQVAGDLVQTTFGVHIIKLEEKRNATNVDKFVIDRFMEAEKNILIDIEDPFLALQDLTNAEA